MDAGETTRLSVDQLEALKRRWREQGAPLLDRLQPGLSDERMDELTEPLGLRLPNEARTWWGWHYGVSRESARLAAEGELGPGLWFYSLDDAVDLYHFYRTMNIGTWGDEADFNWRPEWFPITDRRGAIRCDCSVPDGALAPIYWAFSHDHDVAGLTDPRALPFGAMVDWWLEALDQGWWHYEPSLERWVYEWEQVPTEKTSLV